MDQAERIVLPELHYPFPPAISEHADDVHRDTVSWASRLGLLPETRTRRLFEATGIGRLVARTHPDASPDELRLISCWYAWLFLQDDVRDESETGRRPEELSDLDGRFLAVLEGGEPEEGDAALVRALYDLRERLRERLSLRDLSGVWMRRFVRAVSGHLEATLWEAANRARGIVPDVESYVRMRPLTGGLSIVTELIEIVEGTHLPEEVRGHPTVGRMTDASHNVVCWANDVLSLQKELRRGEVNNLVVVLREAEGLSLQRAMDRAAEMHDAEVIVFEEMEGRLPSFGPGLDANLRRYVAALRHRMRGVWDWSRESERYRAQRGTGPAPSVAGLTIAVPPR